MLVSNGLVEMDTRLHMATLRHPGKETTPWHISVQLVIGS